MIRLFDSVKKFDDGAIKSLYLDLHVTSRDFDSFDITERDMFAKLAEKILELDVVQNEIKKQNRELMKLRDRIRTMKTFEDFLQLVRDSVR